MRVMEYPIIHSNIPYWAAEKMDDENQRRYHVKLRILPDGHNMQLVGKGSENADVGFPVAETLKIALAIPGVAWAQIHANALIIGKSPLFAWEEIERPLYQLIYGAQLAMNIESLEDECLALKSAAEHESEMLMDPPGGDILDTHI